MDTPINLPESAFGQNAEKTPNQNFSHSYYWMENSKGRRVPVAPFNVADSLRRGYIHTDRQLHRDNPADRARPESVAADPIARLADTIEKVVDQKEEKAGGPKRKRRTKAEIEADKAMEEEKVEEVVEEGEKSE